MEGPVDREECVYMAKLAEQAERYDEMVRIHLSLRLASNSEVFNPRAVGLWRRLGVELRHAAGSRALWFAAGCRLRCGCVLPAELCAQ